MTLNKAILILFVFQLFFSLIFARPSSDVNYTNAVNLAAVTHPPYALFDTTTVYLYARDNITNQHWAATFWPRVDEFSQLELTGSFALNYSFNPNLTIWASHMNITLPEKMIYSPVNQLMITYLTAVVLLDNGNVADFSWQDGCSGCTSQYCLDNNCGAFRNAPSNDACNSIDCNIKVYIAWTGRDSSDATCTSISSTPANFEKYSLTPVANFGTGLWGDFISPIKSTAPNPLSQ